MAGRAVGAVVGGGGGAAQAGAAAALDAERYNRQLHVSTYERLKQQCRGSSSSECQTINRMGGVRSGMPRDDASIPASKVVENYDANGKVVSYTLIDARSNQPTMIMEPLEFNAYRNAPSGTQALMQLSPQYALDFASAGLYSVAGSDGRAMEHVTAGVTSRDYVRDVGLGVAGAGAGFLSAARQSFAVNPAMLDELAANGVKFTPQDVVATGRNSNGQVVFLEIGNAKSGLQHIVIEHANDFATVGIPESQILSVVMEAATRGRLVGYQGAGTGRPIYEIGIDEKIYQIAVTVGNNGYVVGANPAGRTK
jgi:hypothetical protein